MSNIVLKQRDGSTKEYSGSLPIAVPKADGNLQVYTAGESVSKTVEPDFSGGDMVVPIAEGELVTGLTIKKPDTLVAENVAEGIDIAGIIGTLTAGGLSQGLAMKCGVYTFAQTTTNRRGTITHNLGRLPDFALVMRLGNGTASEANMEWAYSISLALREKISAPNMGVVHNAGRTFMSTTTEVLYSENPMYLSMCTNTEMSAGSAMGGFVNEEEYFWIVAAVIDNQAELDEIDNLLGGNV